jgi:hypothetical protein
MSLIFPMETAIDKGRTLSFQLQSTIVPYSHNHWPCIFFSEEQQPACCAHKNVHHRRRQKNVARVVKYFVVQNRWKSEGSKAGLYSRYGNTLVKLCDVLHSLQTGTGPGVVVLQEKGCLLLWPDSGNLGL